MQFYDVIGQQPIKDKLIQMVQQNRLSHALLFLGKEGTGALPLALAFAQYVTCIHNPLQATTTKHNAPLTSGSMFADAPTQSDTNTAFTAACGKCPACTKASKLVHPDIHYCYPVIPRKQGDKPISTDFIAPWRQFVLTQPNGNAYDWLQSIDAENKQGNITAEECNDIIRKISLKSFESAFKILIIWMPEMLGKNGNKLLKLIEEPPPDTLFILVAENEALILPTILSRTQLIKIPILQQSDIAQALVAYQGISLVKANQIAALADGNYREALQLLLHADDNYELLLRNWLNAIIKKNLPAQLKWIEDAAKMGREKQKQFFKYFIHTIQQSIRQSVLPHALSNAEAQDLANRLNKLCTIDQHEAIADQLQKATYYIERNANPKLLFHALTIRLYHIISNKSLILIQ